MYSVVVASRKSTSSVARPLRGASVCVSVLGVVIGTVVIVFIIFIVIPSRFYSSAGWCVVVEPSNDTDLELPTTTSSPEMTSSPCHVVGNETRCFRFASNVPAWRCWNLGGVMIKINSSASASSSASTTMCYHNDCPDSFVVGTSCFQYRLALSQCTRGRSDEQKHRTSASRQTNASDQPLPGRCADS